MNPDDLANMAMGGGGISGLIALGYAAWRYILKTKAQDNLEITKDDTEKDLLTFYKNRIIELEQQNDKLRQEAVERGALSAKVEMMNTHIKLIEEMLAKVKQEAVDLSEQLLVKETALIEKDKVIEQKDRRIAELEAIIDQWKNRNVS